MERTSVVNLSENSRNLIINSGEEQDGMPGSASGIEENRWRELPLPLLEKIFQRVRLEERISVIPFVCKSWYESSRSPLCWNSLNFNEIRDYCRDDDQYCSSLLMKLAELGGAYVEVLVYQLSGTLDALAYFAEKCPNLKALRLSASWHFDGSVRVVERLKYILAKWKDLVAVRFDCLPFPLHEIFPVLGENCNKLDFLVLTGKILDDDAAALINFLPRIIRLKLMDSQLSLESLLLILQGCKELQELSLNGYVNFDDIDEEIQAAASHLKTFDVANIRYLDEDYDLDIDVEDFSCTDLSEMY